MTKRTWNTRWKKRQNQYECWMPQQQLLLGRRPTVLGHSVGFDTAHVMSSQICFAGLEFGGTQEIPAADAERTCQLIPSFAPFFPWRRREEGDNKRGRPPSPKPLHYSRIPLPPPPLDLIRSAISSKPRCIRRISCSRSPSAWPQSSSHPRP